MTQEMPQNTRLLKAVVIGLGVMIVALLVIIVVTIILRASRLGGNGEADGQASHAGEDVTRHPAFGRLVLPPLEDRVLEEVTLSGMRLILTTKGPSGIRLEVIDIDGGRHLGTIELPQGEAGGPGSDKAGGR